MDLTKERESFENWYKKHFNEHTGSECTDIAKRRGKHGDYREFAYIHGLWMGWLGKNKEAAPICEQCGDGIVPHNPGICGTCYATKDTDQPAITIEIQEALKFARKELHACQAVIHLAGGFDPAYVKGAQEALAAINKVIENASKNDPEAPSYHDLHITTADISRTSIFNLPLDVIITCRRSTGWELWRNFGQGNDSLVAGEYASPELGLRLDVGGHVIVDGLNNQEPRGK